MKRKKLIAMLLAAALCAALLCGCSPSPTAVTVGGRKVDASEYAFYLYYNRPDASASGTVVYDDAVMASVRQAALDQIVTNEVVRLKCESLGLTLSQEQKDALKEEKAALIESLGGKAAYLEYLHQAYLTDRAYDKFQENKLWYELLYDHMLEDSSVYFTDEMLRQYFAENYATVECICISTLDDEGQPLSAQEIRDKGQLAASVAAQAKAEGADFEALWLEYNEDPSVPMDVPMGRQEAASTYYLKTLFDLAEGQVSSPIEEEDGFYILKRCPLSVSYYDENQAEIYQEALDWRFSQLLDEWKTDYSVTQQPVIQKITLNNLTDYIK